MDKEVQLGFEKYRARGQIEIPRFADSLHVLPAPREERERLEKAERAPSISLTMMCSHEKDS